MDERSVAMAVDLGATHVRVGAVNAQGDVLYKERTRTAKQSKAALLEQLVRMLSKVGEQQPASVIGIAAPGPLNPSSGVIIAPPNLSMIWDTPLVRHIEEHLRLPTFLENDGNLAALGEYRCGAGQNCDPLLYLTLSTGIGGGLIVNGKIFHGAHGMAIEPGHMLLPWNGDYRSLEYMASGPSIERRWSESQGANASLPVYEAARGRDPGALALYQEVGKILGAALASYINLFDPARVVLGGGVSEQRDFWLPSAWAVVQEHVLALHKRPIQIVPAALSDNAGLVGAGLYAIECSRRSDM